MSSEQQTRNVKVSAMDREMTERHLVEAEAAVAKGRQHIEKQLAIIDQLERDGHDATEAVRLLLMFREVQAQHEVHRDRLRAELAQQDQ